MANQVGPNRCHSSATATFGHQTTGPIFRRQIVFDHPKQSHRGAYIQVGPIIRNPIAHSHAQRSQSTGASENTVFPLYQVAVDVHLVQCFENSDLQPFEKLSDRESVPPKRYNRINSQLARTMNQTPSPPIDPENLDLAVADQAILGRNMFGRTAPTYRNDRWMLAEQQDDLAIVALGNPTH